MTDSKIGFIQKLKIRIINKCIKRFMPPPVKANHWEYSCVFSVVDDFSQPSDKLLDLSVKLISKARKIDLSDISKRFTFKPINPDPNIWPGDHYKILAALVKILNPKTVIEIGTSMGISALALMKFLKNEGKVYTFDIVPWNNIKKTLLNESDFESGQLIQHTDDLSLWGEYQKYIKIFEKADLIFVDAKKDGIMEQNFIDFFNKTNFINNPIVIFDDIKNWQMLKIWRDIKHPKMDITSLGHFTGTGIVDWQNN